MRYSILMPGAVVKAGAVIEYAIVAENAIVGADARVGTPPDGTEDWGVAVVANGVKIGPSATISAGAMVTRNVKEGGGKG